jgi:hydroxypyruvate isomerase
MSWPLDRFGVNCSMLFTELPVLERPAAAKAAGFDAVEFWWPFSEAVPTDAQVDEFVTAVTDAGVRLAVLNFYAGDMASGDRGVVSWPGREQEFRDNADIVTEIGSRTGCRAFCTPRRVRPRSWWPATWTIHCSDPTAQRRSTARRRAQPRNRSGT